jgi:hypothetical protein
MGTVSTLVVKDWINSFQKLLVLKRSDLKFVLDDVITVLSWDYNGARDKLSVIDVEDCLVDTLKKLKSIYGVDEVVIIVDNFAETISDPSLFLAIVDKYFRLGDIVEQVKERWERGSHVVPWWYEEKLAIFDNWLCYVIARLAGIYSGIDEVKQLYVRRCRGRLKLFVWVVVSGKYVEWCNGDWEEYEDGVEVLCKLHQVEREVRSSFPLVEFKWIYLHERELDDYDWNQISGVEPVFAKGMKGSNDGGRISGLIVEK